MSVNYNSDNSFKNNANQPEISQKPTIFGQKHPAFVCKHAESFARRSEHFGYKVKCREQRCSLACSRNFSQKLGACLAERLNQVSSGREAAVAIHRGNLTPPPNANADDIRKLRRNFLQRIGRYRDKHKCVIEIHGTLHLTSPTAAHYDIVAFSDLPVETLRNLIRSAWIGDPSVNLASDKLPRYSLVEILDQSTLEAAAKYAAKSERPEVEWRGLPVPRGQAGYLESTWATAGFWGGGGQEGVWESLIARWKESGDLDDRQVVQANSTEQSRFRELLPDEPSEMYRLAVEIAAESGLTIEATRQQIDSIVRSMILQTMPREEASALSVHAVALRWGLSYERVNLLLNGVNNLRKDWQGWLWVEGAVKT